MDELAGKHYRVERIESEILSQARSAAWQMAMPVRGRPILAIQRPEGNRPLVMHEASTDEVARNGRADLIRIFDRESNVVWHREFRRRDAGARKEKEILDDLLRTDVATFRRKYGIVPERPGAVDAAPDTWTPPAAAEVDPWAGLPRPRRNLLDD